jgi:hypothetical protein
MNRNTFGDMLKGKGAVEDSRLEGSDEDSGDEAPGGGEGVPRGRRGPTAVEGEEADGKEKFNDAGIVIEPFNMKNEREMGHIDGNMNFTFEKDEGETDSWLAGLDEATEEQAIGDAARAMEKRRLASRKSAMRAATQLKRSPVELKYAITKMLEGADESISSALKRLAKTSEKGKRDTFEVDILTGLVDELMVSGDAVAYSATKEQLELTFVTWEYRALDGSIQGPFPSAAMAQWVQAGFFSGTSAVLMRKIYPSAAPGERVDKRSESDGGPSSKRARISRKEVQDLENDFADSDDDDSDVSTGGEKNANGNESTGGVERETGPWISSNDLDFS